jgi:hypothetical protein
MRTRRTETDSMPTIDMAWPPLPAKAGHAFISGILNVPYLHETASYHVRYG